MARLLLALILAAVAAFAANLKLYLKDGSYHIVREYKVEGERVRYYSTERGDWEVIPLELVDLKKTEQEIKQTEESRKEETAVLDAEEKAEREARREVERVPIDPGVYLVDGDTLKAFKAAESKFVTSKGRSLLKVMAPIPIVAGKATVELDGETSANVVAMNRPEFYIRLSQDERFGIVRLEKKKGSRIVDKISIMPVTNELMDELNQVEIFRKQVADGVYKIWPKEPLEPGEYAVVEYTEGKRNIQVWDFSFRAK
jgi:hypothetical protein